MSIEIVDARISEYLRRLYDDGDPVRTEMEALAQERHFPIVGPLVGRHLELLTRAIGARRVFELGSGYGYSALHFARAVGEGGVVHCTELDEGNAHLRRGGLFITDNVLWSGRVLEGEDDGSAATHGVVEFTRRLMAHPGFLTAIDPTRDGVAVALRL